MCVGDTDIEIRTEPDASAWTSMGALTWAITFELLQREISCCVCILHRWSPCYRKQCIKVIDLVNLICEWPHRLSTSLTILADGSNCLNAYDDLKGPHRCSGGRIHLPESYVNLTISSADQKCTELQSAKQPANARFTSSGGLKFKRLCRCRQIYIRFHLAFIK